MNILSNRGVYKENAASAENSGLGYILVGL